MKSINLPDIILFAARKTRGDCKNDRLLYLFITRSKNLNITVINYTGNPVQHYSLQVNSTRRRNDSDHQCGFRRYLLTTDKIFCVRSALETEK
jgi:hypothetical protein